MFNVWTLYRKSIKLFHQKLWSELIGPCMAYNSISIKPYIKSHLELQREITLIELAPSPYFLSKVFVLHIWTCLQGLMKIQQWLFKIVRKQNVTDGQCERWGGGIYTFKGQIRVFAGRVKIESHSSCRTSAILKYFCTLVFYCLFRAVPWVRLYVIVAFSGLTKLF